MTGRDMTGHDTRAEQPTYAVVGSGISGLAAAWELSAGSPGARIVVFESEPVVGGKLRSARVGGLSVDVGPDSFVARRPEALELCEEAGLSDHLVAPDASGASIFARGKLRQFPEGLFLGVPTDVALVARSGILSPVGLLRAGLDLVPIHRRIDEDSTPRDVSVGEVVRRHLGSEVASRLVAPLVGGINAGRIDELSASSTFPQLLEARGSLIRSLRRAMQPASPPRAAAGRGPGLTPMFMSVRGGLATLPVELRRRLSDRGVQFATSTKVDSLARGPQGWTVTSGTAAFHADGVVLALPAPAASTLLYGTNDEAARALAEIEHASVAIVTLALPDTAVAQVPSGAGFLVPEESETMVTACTWLSSKWSALKRPREILVRLSLGRHRDERPQALSDLQLVDEAMRLLRRAVGASGSPLDALVTRWPGSFPQYTVGHSKRIADLQSALSDDPSIALSGPAIGGLGIPACIGTARAAARSVLAAVAGRDPERSIPERSSPRTRR